MFAGLSGNTDIVELLLQYGARVNDVNSIGRTASQMAAFVGNHNVVSLINNYLEKEEISVYTTKNKLPSEYISTVHRLILQLNISPIKVFIVLNNEIETCQQAAANNPNRHMLAQWKCVHNILEDLCNKYFTPHLTHEPLALKLHLLACCIRQAGEHYDKELKCVDNQDNVSPNLKQLIKKFLLGTDPYGLPQGQEQFLRHSLTSFPHRQSTLWRHVVQQISPLVLGGLPTAFSILTKAINGSIMYNARPFELCATCGDGPELGRPGKLKACQQCKVASYCSVSCQRLHWFTHKKYCSILKEKKQEFDLTK
uniref:MYND-type domain-containing protein n=2 Tax=Trichobilharzia regenti TaxID=157069 RepID=A0AA85JVP5_TRIRE|nr:unnamed protein product [Trichobilharzia regenti]